MTARSLTFLSVALILMAAGCAQNDDQRRFEQQALSPPQGYTGMSQTGEAVANAEDPDDWRIAPAYHGLVQVETPAWPNPVNAGGQLRIDLYNNGFETLNGIEVFVFRDDPMRQFGPLYTNGGSSVPPGLLTIQLNPSQFASAGGTSQEAGLYRILIYDQGQRNIITYGDVKVL